jgi:MoxR-like ATPase
MDDWKIFVGESQAPTDALLKLPPAPPWRFAGRNAQLRRPKGLDLKAEKDRAAPFIPSTPMKIAVNAALYLRRPLLLTGKPGAGKSTLIAKVAYELGLGPVIRWPISSRSSVRSGIYDYDAVGRLQSSKKAEPPVEEFLRLGPLGTALMGQTWPRPLLIDELDKSDLDFANDLLNVIEEGVYEIPELVRLKRQKEKSSPRNTRSRTNNVEVRDYFGHLVTVTDGKIRCGEFPFVIMTSNAEREFPAPLLRRCIRLDVPQPDEKDLLNIVEAHLGKFEKLGLINGRNDLIKAFLDKLKMNEDLATDQLLNAVFLTVTMLDGTRSFDENELKALRENLFRSLSGT